MNADIALFTPLLGVPPYRELERQVAGGERGVVVSGLVAGARGLVLSLLSVRTGRGLLVVTPDDTTVDAWRRDLSAFLALCGGDPRRVAAFPALDADPYDGIAPHPEVSRERVVVLARLARGESGILVAPARALLDTLRAPEEIATGARLLRPGDVLSPETFLLESLRHGYRRTDVVAAPGEISRRGGIVDVFPPEADEPVRIELFGDTIESLRAFDTDHQRSTRALESAAFGPVVENPATEAAVERLRRYLENGETQARRDGDQVLPFRESLDVLRHEGHIPGFESLAALCSDAPSGLLDHARSHVLVVDEPERCAEAIARAAHERSVSWEQSDNRVLPPPEVLGRDPRGVLAALRDFGVALEELVGTPLEDSQAVHDWPTRRARSWSGRLGDLAASLKEETARGVRTVCAMRAAGSAQRLGEILAGYGLAPAVSTEPGGIPPDASEAGGLYVVVASLREGFEVPGAAMTILAERDVFGEEAHAAERKPKGRAAFISDFRDLKHGDLVVHVDQGVARYAGLGRPKGGSLNRDFMVLEFAGGDRLFVPVDRLDIVHRYGGVAGHRPTLDKLGGPGWERVKLRVRKAVESMARDLLDLYARRRAASGRAFAEDSTWQRELESAFPFVLTQDQERAVEEIKADMESERPMDRLLVGDVGFGKTEVALRAAFKAVTDGAQVAILAPTTVLAAQHYETIRDRFAPFPVRVEMVSRFRSPEDVRRVLAGLDSGEVDLVVGTHRLLSKDVRFRQLGLLVVDEEQRFGVADKERLKRLAMGVDVLSMTATPIPRTLQMSLAGVRDLSLIETAPPGRSAIQTYLIPFRKNVVAQAIRQEIRRGGQVFFVHNRVETIPSLVRALREMVPEARVEVAHGKMGEKDLESVMLRFTHGEADVLVTTTIIENGLDIPRANTIVVNRADRFGLAQLYQLRGRVGRSEVRAYAYMLIPGSHVLTELARRRLKALREFSELGSGFRLAAADLEIRGAGEFLGARQHGHIASLGFDLYCQMLETAVQELKGESVVERPATTLHLGVDIKIPESYMPDVGDRLALYKRLSAARDLAVVDRLQADAEDRRGHLPQAGRNLFDLARLRLVAEAAGVKTVDVVESFLHVRFHDPSGVDPRRLAGVIARSRGRFTSVGVMIVPAPDKPWERIRAARDILEGVLDPTAA